MIDPVSLYINFVLHAIYGKLVEADALMKLYSASIKRVAAVLAKNYPIAPRPIYRGMLLDPDRPFKLDPNLKFMSWSEDRDVASWFASPTSIISELALENNPRLRGFMFTLCEAPPSRVLWHHTWQRAFDNPTIDKLALYHPLMGAEGQRQIEWSLRTQAEVITLPIDGLTPERFDESLVVELDRKFAPPWTIGASS